MQQNSLSASDALHLLIKGEGVKCLDVRSGGEFQQGSFPLFANIPILNDLERHEVGLCYKKNGQDAAIELGHQLVSGHRDELIQKWASYLQGAQWPLVTCWRGGLRSKTAAEWISEYHQKTLRIEGGYKALRAELLSSLENLPELLVISGPTGSGKTALLKESPFAQLDLESLANHRGSAFGEHLTQNQPSQASFENNTAFEILRQNSKKLLIEDESFMIGYVHLPHVLKEKMNASPVVRIQMDLDTRVQNILEDYVIQPLSHGIQPEILQAHYLKSLKKIESKLGHQMASKLNSCMRQAFSGQDLPLHQEWIRELLTHYYDKAYAYSFVKFPRKIAFEGDWNECKIWIQKQFA